MALHSTIPLVLHGVTCEIDERIVPLIAWMNRLSGVRTLACCQGEAYDPEHKSSMQPYVLFTVEQQSQLAPILAVMRNYYGDLTPLGRCEVDRRPKYGIRYHLTWRSPDWLRLTIKSTRGHAINRDVATLRRREIETALGLKLVAQLKAARRAKRQAQKDPS